MTVNAIRHYETTHFNHKSMFNVIMYIVYYSFLYVHADRDPGLNGLTGVTIRGQEGSIEQAKQFIQELIAVK